MPLLPDRGVDVGIQRTGQNSSATHSPTGAREADVLGSEELGFRADVPVGGVAVSGVAPEFPARDDIDEGRSGSEARLGDYDVADEAVSLEQEQSALRHRSNTDGDAVRMSPCGRNSYK